MQGIQVFRVYEFRFLGLGNVGLVLFVVFFGS